MPVFGCRKLHRKFRYPLIVLLAVGVTFAHPEMREAWGLMIGDLYYEAAMENVKAMKWQTSGGAESKRQRELACKKLRCSLWIYRWFLSESDLRHDRKWNAILTIGRLSYPECPWFKPEKDVFYFWVF